MALITDPDYLKQGNTVLFPVGTTTVRLQVNGSGGGGPNTAQMTGTLPTYSQYDYIEIRSSNTVSNGANNQGLYQVTTVTTPGSDYIIKKVAGSQGSLANTSIGGDALQLFGSDGIAGNTTPGTGLVATATGKSVYYDTFQKKIWLIRQGNLTDDGVTFQALYSFTKEQWKYDPYLIQFDFPFTAITPEQFEIGSGTATGWRFYDVSIPVATEYSYTYGNTTLADTRKTRELLRTGGWSEFDASAVLQQQYAGVISLGTFENTNDLAYYQQGNDPTDANAGENFVFTDALNEGVLTYNYYANTATSGGHYGDVTYTFSNTVVRSTGSWITDGFQVGGQIVVVSTDTQATTGTPLEIESLSATTLTVVGDFYADAIAANSTIDTAFSAAWDNRNRLKLFLRANSSIYVSKSYDSGTLADIGVTTLSNQVYRFPLTNSTDIKIDAGTDITATPYSEIDIKYFPRAFQARVDGSDPRPLRDFGIVIDGGTYSGVDGLIADGGTVLTTNASNIPTGDYDGGFLFLHDSHANNYSDGTGPTDGYTIASTTGTSVTISGTTFSATTGPLGDLSFSLTRKDTAPDTWLTSNNLPASIENIYSAVQYKLRQASDIDGTSNTVIGSTADELLAFVGDAITAGSTTSAPSNPNGGGTGVFIAGYAAGDVNDITVVDNTDTARNFPRVVTLTFTFNDDLVTDSDSKFWVFYEFTRILGGATQGTKGAGTGVAISTTASAGFNTTLTSSSLFTRTDGDELPEGDYIKLEGFTNDDNNGIYRIVTYTSSSSMDVVKTDGKSPINETGSGIFLYEDPIDTPSAVVVDKENGEDMIGDVTTASIPYNYSYATNSQGSRTTGDGNASIVVRAIGFSQGQFVEVTDTITDTSKTIAITSGLERNYSNPV